MPTTIPPTMNSAIAVDRAGPHGPPAVGSAAAGVAAPVTTQVHRRRLRRRRREAFGLVIGLHLLAAASTIVIAPTATFPLDAVVLASSMLVWIAALRWWRLLRGWSVRLPAESVADLVRVAAPLALVGVAVLAVSGGRVGVFLALQALIFTALCIQTMFRRGAPASWVRIVGSPSSLGAAVRTFEQCCDLLGRDGCRFAPFRADRPEPEAWRRRIRGWLDRGETVIILEPRLRRLALECRHEGDVVLADDCILFTSLEKPAGPVTDRLLDLVHRAAALLGLLVLWPLGLMLAAAIRLEDGDPIFFAQERVGKDGRAFRILKFRSMRTDAARYAVHPRDGHDPRVTRVGRFMRTCSLDELPQLLNVLGGDMRIVGPRPEMPFIVADYDEAQRARLAVVPGITGLWQVSPHRNDPIHEHLEYDFAYIARRGPVLDLALIIATAGLAAASGK